MKVESTLNTATKVSVVVPVYNVENYIEKCIESILVQSFKEFELIIVDDGSTDGSGKLAEKYAYDARVKVLHKENGGLSDARNHGILEAHGDYICFVDSDDWVEADYIEHMYDLAIEHNADVVICDIKKNTGDESISQPSELEIVKESGFEAIDNIYSARYMQYVVAWNKLYRRTIFDQFQYTVGLIHEDEAIIGHIYSIADRVVRTNRILYNYRVSNDSSIMSKKYSLKRLDILKAMELRMALFQEKGYKKYYEKDSFKYMYKILLNIIEVGKMDEKHPEVIKELKEKYWRKYKESHSFDWSLKRRIGMLLFGICPKAYLLKYKSR